MERSISCCARALSRTVRPFQHRTIAPTTSQCTLPRPSLRPCQRTPTRCLHTTRPAQMQSKPPKSRDRGPKSNEDTQTDFRELDVLRNTIAPATSIDACTSDGFALNNQVRISDSGILLIGGEAFRWWPWAKPGVAGSDSTMKGKLLNAKGQWEVPQETWGALELVYPKPDLLIIGTGPNVSPIAPAVRSYLNGLGMRLEIQDTRNAAAQFNLLATERGVGQVAAALIPIGWKEGK
ncbi:hypothetical protein IQ06DRAFT_298691 [Phaeosphaeriaceae sp. SRC1lsM3a]|nr:hypothetical protein IQ06DRAFT_298691 [Stagonospora sp. SRC1lsM3a]